LQDQIPIHQTNQIRILLIQTPPTGPARPVVVQQPHATDKELWINLSKPFDGERKKFKEFQNAVVLYLNINRHIYDDDEKKIGFILSYLSSKEVAQWREAWIESKTRAGLIWFPTLEDFLIELNAAFNLIDTVGDAMHKLWTMKEGTRPAEELVTEFNLYCSKAGITQSGDTALINLFQLISNRSLLEKILDGETVPMTIHGWKTKAIQLDNNYWQKMAILGKTHDNWGQMMNNTGWWFFRSNNQQVQNQTRDPNAMDVDALLIKQREEAMKRGACFDCGEVGHISWNCPKKQQGGYGGRGEQSSQSTSGTTWLKEKDLFAHICTLTASLPANELDEFLKEAEESGFWNGELPQCQYLPLYLFYLY
jgi:hypothetical protein